MIEHRVPTVRTTPSWTDFARAALKVLPGASKATIGVLWAQFALETARGLHCYGHNIGNRKDLDGDGFNYHVLKGVWEVVNGENVFLAVDDPGSRFCTFASLDEGMREHIDFIRRPGYRHSNAWKFAELGDYAAYARSLGASKYYTAKPEKYVQYGLPHFAEWMRSNAYEQAKASLEPLPNAMYSAMVIASSSLHLRERPTTDSKSLALMPRNSIVQTLYELGGWNEVVFNGQRGFAATKWLARTGAPLTTTVDGLVEVEHDGVTWLVYPIPLGPVTIKQGVELAARMGFELPTPALVDAIYAAADVKIDGAKLRDAAGEDRTDADKINAPETKAKVLGEFTRQLGGRSLGVDCFLITGQKLIVRDPETGKPGLYGLFDANGRPIQTLYTEHVLDWGDWSQFVQVVKPA